MPEQTLFPTSAFDSWSICLFLSFFLSLFLCLFACLLACLFIHFVPRVYCSDGAVRFDDIIPAGI